MQKIDPFFIKRKLRIPLSFVFSCIVHLACIVLLQKSSVYVTQNAPNTQEHKGKHARFLQEIADSLIERPKDIQPPLPSPKNEASRVAFTPKTPKEPSVSEEKPAYKDLACSAKAHIEKKKASIEKNTPLPSSPVDLSVELQEASSLYVPFYTRFSSEQEKLLAEETFPLQQEVSFSVQRPNLPSIKQPPFDSTESSTYLKEMDPRSCIEQSCVSAFPSSDLEIEEPSALPSLQDLQTISWSDAFAIDVQYLEQDEDTILFAATFLPKKQASFTKLSQHIYFLVDTSNAIQKARLKATNSAVQRSLSYLTKEDRFNIIGFDTNTYRFSPENCIPNNQGKKAAREFLQNLRLGSLFSSADPYRPLYDALHETVDPHAVSTLVLITNGDGMSNRYNSEAFLQAFTQRNQGKFQVYCLAMQEDEHSKYLENLALFNRGELYTSHTKGGLKRRLSKLVKSIHYPIAKNVSLTASSRSDGHTIELLPGKNRIHHLYLDTPFVVMGKTNRKEDFILFLQAENGDNCIHIRKEICLQKACSAQKYLEEEWAIEKALASYDAYFSTGNSSHAKKANALLTQHALKPLFP